MVRDDVMKFKRGDLIAIIAVILLALAVLFSFLPNSDLTAVKAEIYLDGELIKTVDLSEEQTFIVGEHYHNTVHVAEGKIAIIESDCPGRDCVHSGAINSSGRVLVCLPNSLEIRVLSAESDVDFVVG